VAFERSYQVGTAPVLDVSTIRGKIDVSVGDADRIVVRGIATVRWGMSVPTTAYELVSESRQILQSSRKATSSGCVPRRAPRSSAR
jgi:hypothetical protein